MSTEPPSGPGSGEEPPQWEELLRSILGPDSAEAIRELRARGMDPEAMAAAAGLPNDPQLLGHILGRVQRFLATSGEGPVNWDLARDVARQTAVEPGDPFPTDQQQRDTTQALAVAELWLDAATDLPPAGGPSHAWSRSQWVERTLATWQVLTEPIAEAVAAAMADVLAGQAPEVLGGFGDSAGHMLRQLGGAVFGMQVGHAVGRLSHEVFGSTDIGLPLLPEPGTALLPANVAAYADGLDVPLEEVRLYLALREAAHARLFGHARWLRAHLLGLIEDYARQITIDMDMLEDAVRAIDPTDPEALQEALSGGVFALETTPQQRSALTRLETTLALIEGWVDEVTAQAAAPHLPHGTPLREMLRRRRAAGGPAEQTFATLVGLELRPRRSREGAALWAQIAQREGTAARDAVWDHPDLLPRAADLDDADAYLARRGGASETAEIDRALEELFDEAERDQSSEESPDADDATDD